MNLFYILGFIIFFISLLLFKRSNEHKSFILSAIIYLILIFIINSLIIFILSSISISANLLVRGITFIVLSIPLLIKTYKSKDIQKYYIKKYEGLFLAIALILTSTIGIYRFGKNLDLYFETTDPANHYLMAERFSESNLLLEKSPADEFYGKAEGGTLFMSYTTLGTLFQLSNNNFTTKIDIFIIFELTVVFLSILIMFYCLDSFIKKWDFKKLLLMSVLSILFTFGYVYNNLIFGFHYLGISILLISILMLLIHEMFKNKINSFDLLILSLFSFSIFITYYLFIPIIYGAVGLYILYQWKILKNISFKEAVKYISVILVIPFIIGMWYYFISNMFVKSSVSSPVNIFKLDGYIYRNLISNFILILVIIINEFIYNLKHKKINVFDLGILMNIVFIVILFFLFYNDKIASYYYYKLYYPLWTLCFISFGITLLSDTKELKTMSISILSLMFIIFIAQCTDIDNKLYQKNPLLNNTTFINGITDIYWFNNNRSNKNIYKSIFSKEELKDITTIYNKYSKELHNNNYYFVGDVMEKLWIYSITRTNPLGDDKELNNFYDEILDINNIESNEHINYIIYSFDEKEMYQSYKFKEIYSTRTYILSQRNV